MYPDGICKVSEKKYSKSIAFEDINYQLAQADDKTAIFENWCDFLNYFDASVNVQLSFINQGSQQEQAARAIHIPPQNDDFNSIRTEYSDMLKMQLAKGNNGLVKHKYITFSIEADNPAAARARLSRIETDVLNNFKVLGVSAHPLSGYERLKVLHGVFHPAGEPFSFSYDWLTPTGLTTKDFIAPSSFKFGEGRYFAMGKKTGAVSFLEILAPELNDRILADMLDLETGVIVNLHIKSIDQSEAIKTIKRKITDLDKMKIEEQKKAVRSGYDIDILPSDLATFGNEAKNLLQDLQSRNERMFLLTFLVVNMADTKRKLENDIFAAAGIAQKYNCALTRLDYQQEAGLMSSIPLGENLMLIVQDQIWNRVTINRAEKKSTRYYMDEFHLLLKEEQTAAYSVEIWKRFRKWGGIPTAITQNIKDLLASREVENIFENSDFVLMLNQAQGDRAILAKQLNISPQQMKYVTHTEAGEGLIFYGNVVLPFVDHFPKDTELYRIMTTKPEE